MKYAATAWRASVNKATLLGISLSVVLAGCSDDSSRRPGEPLPTQEDRVFYILPPGNFGGIPTNENSRDQLPLYDALTPLRGNVTDADIEALFLSRLIYGLGEGQGQLAWEDVMLFDDPEAPTTLTERFEYGPFTGGDVTGSAVIDRESIVDLDPREPIMAAAMAGETLPGMIPAADAPPTRHASNWLIVDAPQSVNETSLAVMGPQLGYYYPEIVQQIHLSGAGIEAQGAAVPGLAMYLLIG